MKRRLIVSLFAISLLAASLQTALAQDTAPPSPEEQAGRPQAPQPKASILFPKEAPISLILEDFTAQTGVPIKLLGKATNLKIAFSGNDLTPEAFLDAIAGANGLKWQRTKDGYELMDEEYYNKVKLPEKIEQKVFIPVHISAKYLHDAIKQSNVLTDNVGNLALDERTNKVIVSDLPEKLALVQDMVNLLDEPQYTRVFNIRYAEIEDIVDKIQQFQSEAGTIEYDDIAHLIIVRDVLSNIQRMEAMIDLLDVRQPRRVYNLNTIGYEGEALDVLQENLETIITKDAFYVIDEDRGMLILEDTETVHEDVEKFLQIFDRPVDQVHIEADLLDVDQTQELNYGMDISYSRNMEAAIKDGLVNNFGTGTAENNPFGFIDYATEFPILSSGSGGLSLSYLNTDVKAQLSAALTDNNTRILLRPRVTVKNREEVRLKAGKETAISTVTPVSYSSSVSSNNFVVTPGSVPSGLEVTMLPSISPTGLIEMKIEISNSTATPVDLATGQTDYPYITGVNKTEDTIETVMIIPDGETRVISGLIDHREEEGTTGIPFLVEIPLIGPMLFGKKSDTERVRNLLFFITPTVVRERAKGNIVAFEFDEMTARDSWDTGKPLADPAEKPEEELKEWPPQEMDNGSTKTQVLDPFTSGSANLPRFEAPLPADLAEEGEDWFLEDGESLPEEKKDAQDYPNSPEGLREAVESSGGKMPDYQKQPKTGWTGVSPTGTGNKGEVRKTSSGKTGQGGVRTSSSGGSSGGGRPSGDTGGQAETVQRVQNVPSGGGKNIVHQANTPDTSPVEAPDNETAY